MKNNRNILKKIEKNNLKTIYNDFLIKSLFVNKTYDNEMEYVTQGRFDYTYKFAAPFFDEFYQPEFPRKSLEKKEIFLDIIINKKCLIKKWITTRPAYKFNNIKDVLESECINIKKTKEFNNLVEKIKISNLLVKKNLIYHKNIWISDIYLEKIENNKFNKLISKIKSKDIENKKIKQKLLNYKKDFKEWYYTPILFDKVIYFNRTNFLHNFITYKKNGDLLIKTRYGLDEVVIELLLRGNHTLKIQYYEFATPLTEKGHEIVYKNPIFKNWKTILPIIVSLLGVLVSILIAFYFKK